LDITSFETFGDFIEVLKLRFEMQEVDRDQLLIRERAHNDGKDYVTVWHEGWDAFKVFVMCFQDNKWSRRLVVTLQTGMKGFRCVTASNQP
jgi:hypothetical protein